MLSVDHFYAVLGCFGMSFEMHWICLDPLVSIDKYSPFHMGENRKSPNGKLFSHGGNYRLRPYSC